MSNDADNRPEDDETRQQVEEIGQKMEELVKLLQRNGQKVATLTVEFEDDPQPRFELCPVEDLQPRFELCPVEDLQPRFELCPVEDPVAGADDPQAPDRDEENLHG